MLVKDRKFLIGLKIFASIALCCTIVLWGALWIASATPGNESGKSTQIVSDKVDSIFNLSSKFNAKVVTQNVILNRPGNKIYFAGQQEQLTVSFLPKNTLDKDVYFVSDHPEYSTVDENGLVTFHSWGWSKIYVYLKSNPSIYNWVSVGCYGPNPDEVEPTIALPSSIKVGTTKGVRLSDNTLSPVSASYSSSDESVALASGGYVSGVSAGTATITATFESGKQISTQITVKENPDFIMPEKIVFKDNPTLVHGSEKAQSVYDLIDRVEPAGAPWDFVVTSSKKSVVSVSYNSFNVMGVKPVTLTYTSRYNPAVSASVTVNITKIPPTELRLAGADVITPHTSTQYSAKHMPQYYEKGVKWEVVSGKATITQNGVLVAKTYGKVVIRCTSTLDPTLSVEKKHRRKTFFKHLRNGAQVYGTRRAFRTARIRHFRHVVFALQAQVGVRLIQCAACLRVRRDKRGHTVFHSRKILHDYGRFDRLYRRVDRHGRCDCACCARTWNLAACKQKEL